MMDIANIIISMVQNVGFPIVAFCAMFWRMREEDISHRDERLKFTQAIENNTIALTEIATYLKGAENDDLK